MVLSRFLLDNKSVILCISGKESKLLSLGGVVDLMNYCPQQLNSDNSSWSLLHQCGALLLTISPRYIIQLYTIKRIKDTNCEKHNSLFSSVIYYTCTYGDILQTSSHWTRWRNQNIPRVDYRSWFWSASGWYRSWGRSRNSRKSRYLHEINSNILPIDTTTITYRNDDIMESFTWSTAGLRGKGAYHSFSITCSYAFGFNPFPVVFTQRMKSLFKLWKAKYHKPGIYTNDDNGLSSDFEQCKFTIYIIQLWKINLRFYLRIERKNSDLC